MPPRPSRLNSAPGPDPLARGVRRLARRIRRSSNRSGARARGALARGTSPRPRRPREAADAPASSGSRALQRGAGARTARRPAASTSSSKSRRACARPPGESVLTARGPGRRAPDRETRARVRHSRLIVSSETSSVRGDLLHREAGEEAPLHDACESGSSSSSRPQRLVQSEKLVGVLFERDAPSSSSRARARRRASGASDGGRGRSTTWRIARAAIAKKW